MNLLLISVQVSNIGTEEDSHTVKLSINNTVEDTEKVILAAGEDQIVSFTVSKSETGDYHVTIDGQEGLFRVLPPPTAINWSLIWGVAAAVAFLLIVISLMAYRRRGAAG